MFPPDGWDATAAVEACPTIGWDLRGWRMHQQRYGALDPGGSLRVSGRYHRGLNCFPEDQVFSALYLALAPEICLGEILRHVTSDSLPSLNNYRVSEICGRIETVLDCRDANILGLDPDDLMHDVNYGDCEDPFYTVTQSIGAVAFAKGAEGILTSSATRLGDNLVLFPGNLSPNSELRVVS